MPPLPSDSLLPTEREETLRPSIAKHSLFLSLSCFFGSSLKYISVQLWSQHIHQPGHITYFWSPFWSLVFGGPLKVCWSLKILTGNKEQPSPVLSGWRPLQDAKCDRRPTRLAAARQPAKRPTATVGRSRHHSGFSFFIFCIVIN